MSNVLNAKRIFLTFALALSIVAIGAMLTCASDDSVATDCDIQSDGFQYSIYDGTTNVTLIGCSLSGHVVVPAEVEHDGVIYDVVTIGKDCAVVFGPEVTSVELNDNVTYIIADSFNGASKLRNITNCNKVTTIGDRAFMGCISLESISFPSVIEIYGSAFYGCTSLSQVDLPVVQAIYSEAFMNCSALTSFYLNEGFRFLGMSVFESCTSLKAMVLPQSFEYMGKFCFVDCSSLESIVLPESPAFTTIPIGAFAYCSSLTVVTVPDNITSIGFSAFQSCVSLKAISLPVNLTSIEKSTFEDCSDLDSISIPGGVKNLGASAFKNCKSLRTVFFNGGDQVSYGEYLFLGCPSDLKFKTERVGFTLEVFTDQNYAKKASVKSLSGTNGGTLFLCWTAIYSESAIDDIVICWQDGEWTTLVCRVGASPITPVR